MMSPFPLVSRIAGENGEVGMINSRLWKRSKRRHCLSWIEMIPPVHLSNKKPEASHAPQLELFFSFSVVMSTLAEASTVSQHYSPDEYSFPRISYRELANSASNSMSAEDTPPRYVLSLKL